MSNNNKKLVQVVGIDEAKIENHLGELVRGTVEQTLTAVLEAETDANARSSALRLVQAGSIPEPAVTSASSRSRLARSC